MRIDQEIKRPIEILLVEDSSDDVELTIEALKSCKMSYHLTVFSDGLETLSFLRKEKQYSNVLKPDIILLDIKLPGKSGHEVLSEIKKDPKLKRIPVIILTTSANQNDIATSYDLHANCYIVKPLDLNQLLNVMRTIEDWLTVVKLPPA